MSAVQYCKACLKTRDAYLQTQTLTALRAVAGDECEVEDTRSRDEPASQIDRTVEVSSLVYIYVSVQMRNNGPWSVVVAMAGESPSNPKTDRLPSFWIRSITIVRFGHD